MSLPARPSLQRSHKPPPAVSYLSGYWSVEEFQEMGEPSVQIPSDFGDPRISVAGEDGARDVCRVSRSVSAIVDNGPQWSMQHNRRDRSGTCVGRWCDYP